MLKAGLESRDKNIVRSKAGLSFADGQDNLCGGCKALCNLYSSWAEM